MSDWRDNLITSPDDVARIVREHRRIAVLGIKTEAQRDQPAFYVPEYMARAGYDIVPVPVYYPDATEILGQPVYRTVSAVPGPVDMVNVFRRPKDIPPHVEDILAARESGRAFDAQSDGLIAASDECSLQLLGWVGPEAHDDRRRAGNDASVHTRGIG